MILKCGLSPTGVRPAVCIDECQVLLRIQHYSSMISPAQKVQVLDGVFGWTGFRPSYANSTWQWLTAAFDPKYAYRAFTLISAVPLRLLLSSASLSEESLVRVCGESQCNILASSIDKSKCPPPNIMVSMKLFNPDHMRGFQNIIDIGQIYGIVTKIINIRQFCYANIW